MLATERRSEIVNLLARKGIMRVEDIARAFDVSVMTIYRDLDYLETDGSISRTYGGAMIRGGYGGYETSFKARLNMHAAQKEHIARTAASYIEAGQTLYLDASTTSLIFARVLKQKPGLTVITNSPFIVTELYPVPDIEVFCTGGELRRICASLVGGSVNRYLEQVHIDVAVMSCTGLTVESGLTEAHTAEAEVKRAVLGVSDRLYVLADASKIGRPATARWANASDINVLVTDDAAPAPICRQLRTLGVRVVMEPATPTVAGTAGPSADGHPLAGEARKG